ncbi:MAG: HYR domain-containing protein [Bacteroidetes bacterium]|nr:HYR domain-containing protein [Bacteroidota bacterium]
MQLTVVISDSELPTITCPVNITGNNDPGLCSKVVTFSAPVGADNCAGPTTTQTAGLASGSAFPVGTTTNAYLVTDAAGNTATCSFTVVISDNELPTITCPANITGNNDPGPLLQSRDFLAPVALTTALDHLPRRSQACQAAPPSPWVQRRMPIL